MEQTKAAENLSQWFNLDEQKPWEPGVYEFQSNNGIEMFAYWDGYKAFMGTPISFGINECVSIAIDDFNNGLTSIWSENVCKWRGLASDPSAKPKARGNRKVTRYVVMREGAHWNRPIAVFDDFKSAEKYKNSQNKKHNELLYLETVRFRTHEAS